MIIIKYFELNKPGFNRNNIQTSVTNMAKQRML